MERDSVADDQMIVLALSELAIPRPGWLWTIQDLCDGKGWRDLFDGFQEIANYAPKKTPAKTMNDLTGAPVTG